MKSLLLSGLVLVSALPLSTSSANATPFDVACTAVVIAGGSGNQNTSCSFDAGAGFEISSLTLFSTPDYAGGSAGGTQVDFSYSSIPAPLLTPQNFSVTGTISGFTSEQNLGSYAPLVQSVALTFNVASNVSFGSVQSSLAGSRIVGETAAIAVVPEPGTLILAGTGLALLAWRRRSQQSSHAAG